MLCEKLKSLIVGKGFKRLPPLPVLLVFLSAFVIGACDKFDDWYFNLTKKVLEWQYASDSTLTLFNPQFYYE